MHTRLGGHFRGREPSVLAKEVGRTGNPIGLPGITHQKSGEGLSGTGAQASAVERIGQTPVRPVRGESLDRFDVRGGSAPKIGWAEGPWAVQRGRGLTIPADVNLDRFASEQGLEVLVTCRGVLQAVMKGEPPDYSISHIVSGVHFRNPRGVSARSRMPSPASISVSGASGAQSAPRPCQETT